VDALLASGEAILGDGILNLARPMTTEEWVAKCVCGGSTSSSEQLLVAATAKAA
jgi:hypothetical protein